MYYFSSRKKECGFTLIEIMVVISIITILFAIVMASIVEARKSTRDKKRAADLAEIALIMRLYLEKNGSTVVDCINGLKIDGGTTVVSGNGTGSCTDGADLLNFIAQQSGGTVPSDPLGPGNANYYYYFDGDHNCNDATGAPAGYPVSIPMIFAANTERRDTNRSEVCPYFEAGNEGGFERTAAFNPSAPYVVPLLFMENAF